MTQITRSCFLAMVLAASGLGGCAQQDERPVAAASVPDDDAICQAKGFKAGSDDYVNCRRDRDYIGSLQAQQSKRNVRKMQDYMMDNK